MYLLDSNDKELLKFYVDLGNLSFLGKELRNIAIYHYPIIIFEFMNGYFTTEELYEQNKEISLEFTKDYEIMELPKEVTKVLKQTLTFQVNRPIKMDPRENKQLSSSALTQFDINEQLNNNNNIPGSKKNVIPDTKSYDVYSKEFKAKLDINIKSQIERKNSTKIVGNVEIPLPIPPNETPAQKIENKENPKKNVLPPEISPSKKNVIPLEVSPLKIKKELSDTDKKYIRKYQRSKFFEYVSKYQMLIYLINPQENIKETNPNFGKELEIFNDELEKYKRKLRIMEMEKELEFLTKKNNAIELLNIDLEKAIKHKKENLEKVKIQLKPNQINYTNKLNQLKNNLNGRGQYQLIYDSFVYQKMAEVCFVFFNNKIESLYSIPRFYNEPLTYNEIKKLERLEWYNSEKKNISAMMGYICQLLIYLSKTFNIPLRFPIFLNGSRSYILRSVKDKVFLPLYFDAKKDDKHGNFESALNCLKDDIKEIFNFLSMFPEIISKTDNENVNNMNGKYLFFFFFVIFNHSLSRFMKTLQNAV